MLSLGIIIFKKNIMASGDLQMEIDGLDEGALRRILSRVASVNPGAVAQEIAVLRGVRKDQN